MSPTTRTEWCRVTRDTKSRGSHVACWARPGLDRVRDGRTWTYAGTRWWYPHRTWERMGGHGGKDVPVVGCDRVCPRVWVLAQTFAGSCHPPSMGVGCRVRAALCWLSQASRIAASDPAHPSDSVRPLREHTAKEKTCRNRVEALVLGHAPSRSPTAGPRRVRTIEPAEVPRQVCDTWSVTAGV